MKVTKLHLFNNKASQYIFIVCAFIMSVCGCKKQSDINNVYNKMYNSKVVLPVENMKCCHKTELKKQPDLKMITFVDTSECTPCAIGDLQYWELFVNESHKRKLNIEYIFIIAPQKGLSDRMFSKAVDFKCSLYIDSAYVFKKCNQFIPQRTDFHSFIIDKKNRVVFIGNPTKSEDIEKLYNKFINHFKH